jgi:hypothetical protein
MMLELCPVQKLKKSYFNVTHSGPISLNSVSAKFVSFLMFSWNLIAQLSVNWANFSQLGRVSIGTVSINLLYCTDNHSQPAGGRHFLFFVLLYIGINYP